MQTYLTMLYVTLEQEVALKEYFISKGWSYSKPDLNVVTDRVGPFCSPKALKTDSGNIITFNEMSTNDTNDKPTEARSKIVKKRDKNVTRSAVVPDVIKVEVSPEGQECLDGYGSDDADKSLENDDGDNDDDYADDINNKIEEMEENIAGDNLSPKNPGRPVRNSHKASIMNLDTVQEKSGSEQEGTSVTPSGRKRRKVAARAEATIQSVMSEEKDESKNSSLLVNKQHLRQLLTEALRSSKTRKESSKMDFATCPQCKKRIRNTNLRRHLLLHFDLPYRCTRCSSYYTSQEELEKHRLEKHMGEFICSYCGLKYRFKNSLTEHIQTRHEGTAKMYHCTVCGVKMCRKSHMDDHMNIHNDVNPYSCQKCSKSYKNKSAFKRHMKDCGSGVKHVCSVCGQIYKSSVGLQDHMRRCHDDTNRYLFSCVCKASFKTRAARCRHRVHCDIYQNEKNVIQSHSVQQNVTILSVTSSDVQNFYRENSLLSNADQGIRNDDIVQNAGYELVEVSPDDVNVINVTDALEQGEIVASGETFNEISEPSHTFE